MSIFIDKNGNGTYGKHKNQITTKKSSYEKSNLFFIITHTETNPEPSKRGVRDVTYLTFTSNLVGPIRSFFTDDGRFDRAEVLFSTHNENKPLILGIIAGTHRYYKLSNLKNQVGNILHKPWFGEKDLLDNLIKENNKQNKVITYRIDKTTSGDKNYDGVTVEPIAHPSFDKYKHIPTDLKDKKISYVLYKGYKIELDSRISYQGKDKLTKLQENFYCDVLVYYFKSENNNFNSTIPIYLELEEKTDQQEGSSDISPKKYHIQRTDNQAIKWKQIENPNLENTITYLLDRKNIGSYNNSIEITKAQHVSFDVYIHTPTNKDKLGLLLYNFRFIELLNSQLPENVKITELKGRKYTEVGIYYFKLSNTQSDNPPKYLKLTATDRSENSEQEETCTQCKTYYLERADFVGVSWKQIINPNLDGLVTYFLDKRPSKSATYNDDSIAVTKSTNESFDIYTHKPETQHTNKKAYLRYNDKDLELLDNEHLETKVERLKDFNWHVYCSVSLFYYKSSGQNTLPTFLELITKGTGACPSGQQECASSGSKCYLFQIADEQGLKWIQIGYQDLRNSLTYQLEFMDETKKYNDNSVTVTKDTKGFFEVYTHTPKDSDKFGLFLYKQKMLTLQANDTITGDNILKKLHGKNYSSVAAYYPKDITDKPPLYLKITSESGTDSSPTTDYLLQRIDQHGLFWKQITEIKLENVVTYYLDKKLSDNQTYNEISVKRENDPAKRIDTYIHKPNDEEKTALLLYDSNLISLERTDEYMGNDKVTQIQNICYSIVKVVYTDKTGLSIDNKIPILVELSKKNDGSETNTNTICVLRRIDDKGLKWAQTDQTIQGLTSQLVSTIANEIDYDSGYSIIVELNKFFFYEMNLIANYENDFKSKRYSNENMVARKQTLTNPKYVYYTHSLFKSSQNSEVANVVGLRTYIGNTEIKLYNSDRKKQNLKYNPLTHVSKTLDVYFYVDDTFPFSLKYDNAFYIPSSKDDYLKKWILRTDIKSSETTKLTGELDKINKIFNEILLENTDPTGYGITVPKGLKSSSGFQTKRVNVTKTSETPPPQKFGKVSHQTVNNSSIGAIKFNEHELKDSSDKKLIDQVLSDSAFNKSTVSSVSAFYHNNDSGYTKPLLLGFAKSNSGGRNDLFYERLSVRDETKWKKIDQIAELRQNEGLEKRINSIRYNIGKSIIVRVDHQLDQGGSGDKYDVQLVENKDGSGNVSQPSGGDQIKVSKDCTPKPSPKDYTCLKHEIPDIGSSTGSETTDTKPYVSGLKFYICKDKHLPTDLPIYYNSSPGHREVKVYFYGNTSGKPPVDKVPLLVEYNSLYYKPSSRDEYFQKWIEVKVSEQNRGDSVQGKTLEQVLEEINKDLNTIELEKTSDNGKYGIKEPSLSAGNCCSKTPVKDFCNRVTVTRDSEIYKDYYLMVTHKTLNKGPIGSFKYQVKKIDGIKTEKETATCNQVHVYYLNSDSEYRTPLLVCLGFQEGYSNSGCKKWFSRMGIDINSWNEDDNNDNKFDGETKIKTQLELIHARMANYLYLEIGRHNPYSAYVQKGSEGNSKHNIGTINVSQGLGADIYKADSYRYYEHKLKEYYTASKKNIQSTLRIEDQGGDLTLQVKLYISNNNFLGLLGTDGKSELTNPLVYGKDQSGNDTNDPCVYFFEPTGGEEDKVPLLLKFGDTYFGPKDKNSYFEKWREYDLSEYTDLRTDSEKIKAILNHITRKLNEIKLEKTNHNDKYGDIKPPGKGPDPLGANKRVTVTRNNLDDYNTVTHSTANTGCVGTVTHSGQELQIVAERGVDSKPWSTAIETELKSKATAIYDTLTAYYHHSDNECTKPLVIAVTGTGTTNLHYKRKELSDNYKWVKVTDDLKGDAISNEVNQIYYGFTKSVAIQLEKRPTTGAGSSKEYQLKVVNNGGRVASQPEPSGSGENISVSAFKCLSDSSYICVKHTIKFGNGINETDIGGLRLYLGEKEVQTSDTRGSNPRSVFYQQKKKEVHVYFYALPVVEARGSHGTNTRRLYTPPLLFEYNSNFYKPQGRDNYFEKWVYFNIVTRPGGGQTDQSEQLKNELNNVNKTLNRIDLDNIATTWSITGTDDTGQANTCRKKYGIPYPGKDPPDPGVDKSFYERIIVRACVTTNYRKQVHTTINKYQVGDLYLYGKQVSGIEPQSQHNQVEVYYDPGDHHFSRPLLIKLTSQKGELQEEPSSSPKALYKRGDLGGTKWETVGDDETSSYGSQDESFKDEIGKIASQLYTTLSVELEKKKQYNKNVSVNSYIQTSSNITVSQPCSSPGPFVQDYQCCEHKLSEYYKHINDALNSQPEHKNPTLVLAPEISGIKLGIFTSEDKVAPILTYAKTDFDGTKSLVVYFWKGDGGADSGDPVPLIFNYNEKFYGPVSKEKYFGHWKELVISSPVRGSGTTDLKQKLDDIYNMLNGIELNQTKTYGIRCCKEHPYYNNKGKGFNCKRIRVTSYKGGTHKMYVHQTVGKNKIGKISHKNPEYKFDQHNGQLNGKKVDQVAVIYKGTGITTETPVLVLLNQAGPGQGPGLSAGDDASDSSDPIKESKTHGYYYHDAESERGDTPISYKFHHISAGCKMMAKLMNQGAGDGGVDDDCVQEQTSPLNGTWNEITRENMTKDDAPTDQDVETKDCTGPILNELNTGKCEPGKGEDSSDRDDLVQMESVQDDRPKVGLGGHGPDERGGSASMGAGAKPGPESPSGKQGRNGKPSNEGSPGKNELLSQPGPGQQPPHPVTDHSPTRPSPPATSNSTTGHGTQKEPHGGGVDDGLNGGGASLPAGPSSSSSSAGETTSAQRGSENSSGGGDILEALKNPAISGGAGGGVAGVGVMATVGAVVF